MPKTRTEIINEARSYINTPFMHQGKLKGQGIDCDNFIINLAKFGEVIPPDVEFPNNYGRDEDGSLMVWFLENFTEQIDPDEAKPCDILAWIDHELREPEKVRHLVLVTEVGPRRRVIHASTHGVREHNENRHFRQRVHSAWRPRGLKDE